MIRKTFTITLAISLAALILNACGKSAGSSTSAGSSNNGKLIKSTTANGLTITLANDSGALKSGESDLVLSFADQSGKPVDVGAASLKFHMPAMGAMVEMNDAATLTTTKTPGAYHAHVNIEVEGTWEAIVNYEGPKGSGQASMTMTAK